MNNKWFSIPAFLMVWMFAISMLSNCYCVPTQPSISKQEKMASHCHQAANKEKNSDCAPRFQTDNFESVTIVAKITQPPAAADLILTKEIKSTLKENFSFSLNFESPPVSPPEFFVLHHSFLI